MTSVDVPNALVKKGKPEVPGRMSCLYSVDTSRLGEELCGKQS